MAGSTVKKRFLSFTTKTTSCWLWNGNLDKDGYGRIFVAGRGKVRAHRIAFELYKHKIPKKLLVCHKCDNPRCVRPAHLWLGTHVDNMQDMISKGRHGSNKKRRSARL